jgi:hypothetical protein
LPYGPANICGNASRNIDNDTDAATLRTGAGPWIYSNPNNRKHVHLRAYHGDLDRIDCPETNELKATDCKDKCAKNTNADPTTVNSQLIDSRRVRSKYNRTISRSGGCNHTGGDAVLDTRQNSYELDHTTIANDEAASNCYKHGSNDCAHSSANRVTLHTNGTTTGGAGRTDLNHAATSPTGT